MSELTTRALITKLLVLYFGSHLLAQQYVTWGGANEKNGWIHREHIGSYNDFFFELIERNKKLYIQQYDYKTQLLNETLGTLPNLVEEKKMNLRKVLPLKSNLMFFTTRGIIGHNPVFDLITDKDADYFQAISWVMKFNGEINREAVELINEKQKTFDDYRNSFWIQPSPDSSLAVSVYASFEKGSEKANLQIQVINHIAYENKLAFQVSLDGITDKFKKVIVSDEHLFILMEDEWELLKIGLFDKKIERLSLNLNEVMNEVDMALIDQQLLIAARYGYTYKKKFEKGVNILSIDIKSLEVLNETRKPFPAGFYNSTDKSEVELYVDDKVLLFAIEPYNHFDGQYKYTDLMMAHYSLETSELKFLKIPKKQITRNDKGRFSSFGIFKSNEFYHIVYNDNPKNINLTDEVSAMKDPQNSYTFLVKVSKESGEFSEKIVLSENLDGLSVCPKHLIQNKSNVIFLRQDKRRFEYGFLNDFSLN